MPKLKHLSLFSGIGGPDLAAEWMGWDNVSHTEWNAFGQRVLNYYWPNATSHHDITKTDYTIYRGRVDILTGGFPCQGFSLAGKRLGTDDDRYLWPEMRRAYQECKPCIVIGENVTGLLSMEDKSGVYRDVFPKVEGGTIIRTLECDYYEKVYTRQAKMLIDSICKDLEQDGYEVIPFIVPAAAVQAPHQRERVWIIAYAGGDGFGCDDRAGQTGSPQGESETICKQRQRIRRDIRGIGTTRNVAYRSSESGRRELFKQQKKRQFGRQNSGNDEFIWNAAYTHICIGWPIRRYATCERRKISQIPEYCNACSYGNAPHAHSIGQSRKKYRKKKSRRFAEKSIPDDWKNFPTQSPVCDGNDGIPARLDTETIFKGYTKPMSYSKWRNESIKAGGNAIVPQVILEFFKVIDEFLNTAESKQ
jgi:DNA (cytosine-5)-methyltransferase 1